MLVKDIRKAQFVTDIRNLRGLYSAPPPTPHSTPIGARFVLLSRRHSPCPSMCLVSCSYSKLAHGM